MTIKSAVTGKSYDDSKVVFFYNLIQCMKYMKHGALPLDILVSKDKLIFVFDKKDHQRLKEGWINGTL